MVAILHEGNAKKTADNELLKLLIENLNLDITNVKFFGIGTKSNFFKIDNRAYKELLMEFHENIISKILFVVDADYQENDLKYGGYENTKKELEKVINELGLKNYSDIYITCDPKTKSGYLESLILSSIPKKQKECIEDFLDCSEFKSKENYKAILNQIYKIAYPNAPFDFSHPNFNKLKQKLKNIFKEQK
ncbi:MAG: hypothetical protein GXO60_06520 [Epsilonproteobacteria bacterium]|nr:hypothetical protein [Campylobacterota bacterium]